MEKADRSNRPLWQCRRCGRYFANPNQSHSCGRYELADHFVGRDPEVVATYEAFEAAIREHCDVIVLPEKTRIAFQVRMSFAVTMLRRHWIDAHVVLARRLVHPRFRKIETYSPRSDVHQFRLEKPEDVDDDVRGWLAEAYAVGCQQHLRDA